MQKLKSEMSLGGKSRAGEGGEGDSKMQYDSLSVYEAILKLIS